MSAARGKGWDPEITEYRFHHKRRDSELEDIAWLVAIPQPFGLHLVVSAFDGENQYSLICTGGHKADVVVVKHIVDSEALIRRFDHLESAQECWLNLMPDGLRTATRAKLDELIKAERS